MHVCFMGWFSVVALLKLFRFHDDHFLTVYSTACCSQHNLAPLVNEPIYYQAKHLYRASLKVLGGILKEDERTLVHALELWREAAIMDSSDVALWYKLGKLVKHLLS